MTLRKIRNIGFGVPLLVGFFVWVEAVLAESDVVLILTSTLGFLILATTSLVLAKITRLSMFIILVISSWWLICIGYIYKFISATPSVQRTSDLGFLESDFLLSLTPSFSALLFLFLLGYMLAVFFCSRRKQTHRCDSFPIHAYTYYKRVFFISLLSLITIFILTSFINLSLNVRSGGQGIDEIQLPFKLRGILLNLSTSFPTLLGGVLLISAIRLDNRHKLRMALMVIFFIALVDVFIKTSKGVFVSWVLLVMFAAAGEYLRYMVSNVALPRLFRRTKMKLLAAIVIVLPLFYLSYHIGTASRIFRSEFIAITDIRFSDFLSYAVSYLSYINENSTGSNNMSLTSLVTPERLTGTPSALASYMYGFAPFNTDFSSKIVESIKQANFHLFEHFGTYEVMQVPSHIKMGVALSTLGFLYVFFGIIGVFVGSLLVSFLMLLTFSKLINSASVLANSMAYSFPIFAIGFWLEGSLMTMLFSIIPIYLFAYFTLTYLIRRIS